MRVRKPISFKGLLLMISIQKIALELKRMSRSPAMRRHQ
jgi:hypothetical protein